MKRKFTVLVENITRHVHGGFLAGDVVKFKKNAFSHRFFKECPAECAEQAKKLIESGVNLRAKNIKTLMPAVMGAGNTDNNGYSFSVEVTPEIAPGRYDINQSLTVPHDTLERVDYYPSLPEVPEKFKRDNKTQIKPIEVKDEAEEVPFYSPFRTRTSDAGNKQIAGDRTLLNQNTKIPASPAEGQKDPAQYTARYRPKQ